jgi:hypothetical protein
LQHTPVSQAEHVAPPKNVPPVAIQAPIVVNVQPPPGKQHAPLEHAIHVNPKLNTPVQLYLKTFSLQVAPTQQDPVSQALVLNIPTKKVPSQLDCLIPTCSSPFCLQHVPIVQ